MSWKATSWAAEQRTGSPISKLVLLKLADNANDEGVCWPSLDTIADHTELSRRTVQDHLLRLADKGVIFIEERRAENGASLSNRYRLAMEAKAGKAARKGDAGGASGEGAGAAPRSEADARDRAPDAGGRVQPAASHIDEPPIEPPKNRHSHAPADAGEKANVASLRTKEPDRFPDFRDAVAATWPSGYPATDFGAGLAEWDKATRLEAADLLIECAKAHGAWLIGQNAKRGTKAPAMWEKRPSNWLREGGWKGYTEQIEREKREAGDKAARMAAIRAGLGQDVVDGLKRAKISDNLIDMMEGVVFERGDHPRIICPTSFVRSRLQDRSMELGAIWPGLSIDVVERRATA